MTTPKQFIRNVDFLSTTNSTNSSNGSVVFSGGVGIQKDIFASGNMNILGNLNISGSFLQSSGSQWTPVGSNIAYTTGNVGINTTSPQFKLDVNGTINSTLYTGSNLSVTTASISNLIANNTIINNTTNSIGLGSSASLNVLGGMSVLKDVYIGSNLYINSTSGQLSVVSGGSGILTLSNFNSTGQIQLRSNNSSVLFYSGSNFSTLLGGFDNVGNFSTTLDMSVGRTLIATNSTITNITSTNTIASVSTIGNILLNGGLLSMSSYGKVNLNPAVTPNSGYVSWHTGNTRVSYLGFGNNDLNWVFENNNSLNLAFSGGSHIFSNTGFVGIGTVTPKGTLDLGTNVTNRKIIMYQNSGLNDDNQFYGFGVNSAILRYQVDTPGANHVFYAGSSATTSVELMRIQGNGFVGIGTATPGFTLDVSGTIRANSATNSLRTSSTFGSIALRVRGGDNAVTDFGQNGAGGGWIQVGDALTVSTAYPLLLQPIGGNIGINTSTFSTFSNYPNTLAGQNISGIYSSLTGGISNLTGVGLDVNGAINSNAIYQNRVPIIYQGNYGNTYYSSLGGGNWTFLVCKDATGSVVVGGDNNIYISGQSVSLNGNVNVSNTTLSTSPTSGAFIVSGGVGIVGNLNSGLIKGDGIKSTKKINSYGSVINSKATVTSTPVFIPLSVANDKTRVLKSDFIRGVTTWYNRTSLNATIIAAAWSSTLGMYVATGQSVPSKLYYSFDGLSWVTISMTDSLLEIIYVYELSLFVGIAATSVFTSPDGITWTSNIPAGTFSFLYGVMYSSELNLIVIGGQTSGNGYYLATSSIGTGSWTSRTLNTNSFISDIVWSSELMLFTAVGNAGNNSIITSPDGINWTNINTSAFNTTSWTSIVWAAELGMFIVSSYNTTTALYSYDGITFTSFTLPIAPARIYWIKELSVFVYPTNATSNSIYYTYNGLNWNSINSLNNSSFYVILCYSPELSIFVTHSSSNGFQSSSIIIPKSKSSLLVNPSYISVNNNNGFVGIGTVTPKGTLDLATNVTNRKIIMYQTSNDDNQFYGFGINSAILRYQVDTPGSNHVFYAGLNSTTSTELLRIQGNGFVGIGTANPGFTLDVNGSGNFSGLLSIANTTNSSSAITGSITTTGGIGIAKSVNIGGNLTVTGQVTNNATTVMNSLVYMLNNTVIIDGTGTGNITSVNGILQIRATASGINGDGMAIRAGNDSNNIINFINTAGNLRGFIGGNGANAVSYNTSSDRRLKTNIIDMISMKDTIMNIKPRQYKWKDSTSNYTDYGFVAQEIFDTLPHLRPHSESDTRYYGLDYGKFTPFLTKALQETITELEMMKKELKDTKCELESIKSFLNLN